MAKQDFYIVDGGTDTVEPHKTLKTDGYLKMVGNCVVTFYEPVIPHLCCITLNGKGIEYRVLSTPANVSFVRLFVDAGEKEQTFKISVGNDSDQPQTVGWKATEVAASGNELSPEKLENLSND